MKLSIILTLALLGCGSDEKSVAPVTTPATAPEPVVTAPTPTETTPDHIATVVAGARALVKGKTLAAIDATALAALSLDESVTAGAKAYYKGVDRVTFYLCPGTTTVQAYTIKSEAKVLLYTQCADMLGTLAPTLAIRDVWAQKLDAEQLAYAETLKTTDTSGINGNPAKYYTVAVSKSTNGVSDYYYSFDLCENGKIFSTFNDVTTTRDTTICN